MPTKPPPSHAPVPLPPILIQVNHVLAVSVSLSIRYSPAVPVHSFGRSVCLSGLSIKAVSPISPL